MPNTFTETFTVTAQDYTSAGEVSAKMKSALRMIGIDPTLIRRVIIAAYESELNMIIHSYGGTMTLHISPAHISLRCDDTGPGIDDIDMAMREGFSTASSSVRMMGFGAGMGLPNIKRNSDEFDIQSGPGGTHLTLGFNIDS